MNKSQLLLLSCAAALFSDTALADDPLLDVFPDTPASTEDLSSSTYSSTTSLTVAGPTMSNWWITAYPESSIFRYTVESTTGLTPSKDWSMRIGKGGQIYSFTTPAGEAIGPQWRPFNNQYQSDQWAPWVDDVFQAVATNSTMNCRRNDNGTVGMPADDFYVGPYCKYTYPTEGPGDHKYFMHGSGVYVRDAAISAPFYNPELARETDVSQRAHKSVHWMQQAHTPSPFPSHVLNYYSYKDLGGGVLEVSVLIHNFGVDAEILDLADPANDPGDINYLNLPWGGVRETTFGKNFVTDTSGTLYEIGGNPSGAPEANTPADATVECIPSAIGTARRVRWSEGCSFDTADTAGWFAFAKADAPTSDALAIVFGGEPAVAPSWQIDKSTIRFGYALPTDPDPNADEETFRNLQIFANVRRLLVEPGETIQARWYYVTGALGDLGTTINGRNLVQNAAFSKTSFGFNDTEFLPVFLDTNGKATRAGCGLNPVFYTFSRPVNGTKPLFRVVDANGNDFITTDPYELSDLSETESTADGTQWTAYRAYDGETASWELLGYVPTASSVPSAQVGSFSAINSLLPNTYYLGDPDVHVRTVMKPEVRIENDANGPWLYAQSNGVVRMESDSATGVTTRWDIVASPNAGEYYIESKSTGERLIATSLSTVSQVDLADPSASSLSASWELTNLDQGQCRIVNKDNGRFLMAKTSGQVELFDSSATGDFTRWRFVPVRN